MDHSGSNGLCYLKLNCATCHKYSLVYLNLMSLGFGCFVSTVYLHCPIWTCQNTCLLAGNVFYFLSEYEVRSHFPVC